ncbi:MAG: hypothetical protein NVS2B7_05090 [Herpetosiphon sp.]
MDMKKLSIVGGAFAIALLLGVSSLTSQSVSPSSSAYAQSAVTATPAGGNRTAQAAQTTTTAPAEKRDGFPWGILGLLGLGGLAGLRRPVQPMVQETRSGEAKVYTNRK